MVFVFCWIVCLWPLSSCFFLLFGWPYGFLPHVPNTLPAAFGGFAASRGHDRSHADRQGMVASVLVWHPCLKQATMRCATNMGTVFTRQIRAPKALCFLKGGASLDRHVQIADPWFNSACFQVSSIQLVRLATARGRPV